MKREPRNCSPDTSNLSAELPVELAEGISQFDQLAKQQQQQQSVARDNLQNVSLPTAANWPTFVAYVLKLAR